MFITVTTLKNVDFFTRLLHIFNILLERNLFAGNRVQSDSGQFNPLTATSAQSTLSESQLCLTRPPTSSRRMRQPSQLQPLDTRARHPWMIWKLFHSWWNLLEAWSGRVCHRLSRSSFAH